MSAGQACASCGLMYIKSCQDKVRLRFGETTYGILITRSRIFPLKPRITKNSCLLSNIYMMSWSNLCTALQWPYCKESHTPLSSLNLSPYYKLSWGINRSFPQNDTVSGIQLSAQNHVKIPLWWRDAIGHQTTEQQVSHWLCLYPCCCLETGPQGELLCRVQLIRSLFWEEAATKEGRMCSSTLFLGWHSTS